MATPVKETRDKRRMAMARMPPDLLKRLDQFCRTHPLRPSRTRVMETAIRQFLDREEQQHAAQSRA